MADDVMFKHKRIEIGPHRNVIVLKDLSRH